jgi:hypothetical protein
LSKLPVSMTEMRLVAANDLTSVVFPLPGGPSKMAMHLFS